MVCRPTVMLCVRRGGVSCVSDRAQLGRLGGSRWGWVLQIKFPCQHSLSLSLSLFRVGFSDPNNHQAWDDLGLGIRRSGVLPSHARVNGVPPLYRE